MKYFIKTLVQQEQICFIELQITGRSHAYKFNGVQSQWEKTKKNKIETGS